MKKWVAGVLIVCILVLSSIAALAADAALTLNRDSLTLSVGRYTTVHTSVIPAGALREGASYSVSDTSIASVDQNGKVRGLKAGECTLTAVSLYDSSVSVTIPLYIVVPVKDIQITAPETGVVVGSTLQLSVTYTPADATNTGVVFTSSDESILTVTGDGLVTGLQRGKATVKAVTLDGRTSDTLRITVKQKPDSVTVAPETLTLAEGKTGQLKAAVLPKTADDKTVLWTSADPGVATVSDRGVVTGVRLGSTVITAVCKDNAAAAFSIPVNVTKLASGVSFDQAEYEVVLGQSLTLSHTVSPETTSNQAVTYKISNSRVATVDANGMVTAKKGGTATVTITTADGSKKSATAKIKVLVPVTGVHYNRSDIRVGQSYYAHVTAALEPADATDTRMNWTVADPGIATVEGDTNTVKITGGEDWGRTTVTGVTVDGGYSVSFFVNVGSLYRAIGIRNLEIRSGQPYIVLRNNSDMNITQVRFTLRGLDAALHPVQMSTTGDFYTLFGTYDLPLYAMEQTQYDLFSYFAPSLFPNLAYLQLTITGWSTDTGYFDSNGTLQYAYAIEDDRQPQSVYPANTDPALFAPV